MKRKLDRLSDMLLDNEIDNDLYKEKRLELLLKSSDIEEQIKDMKSKENKFSQTVLDTVKEASDAYELFKAADKVKKREIIEKIFEKLELKGEQLQYVIRYPYDGLVKNIKM